MAADEEVVIKIDQEADPDPVVVKTDADPALSDLVSQYKELEKRDGEREREKNDAIRRAADAAADAARARSEAAEARKAASGSHLDAVNTALENAKSEVEAAKRDIKLAGEAGDYEALANAQERLAGAKSLALRYDEAKDDLETRAKAPPKPEPVSDPVEAYVQGRTALTAAWLRSHPDYITDRSKNAKLTAAHWNAVGDGLSPDTPEYFEHVETFIGLRKVEMKKEDKPAARRNGSPAAAPVDNSAGGGASGTGNNEVRLSAREAAAAVDGTHVYNYDDPSGKKRFKKGDPIGVQEFARRKLEMTKQGAYDRSYEVQ